MPYDSSLTTFPPRHFEDYFVSPPRHSSKFAPEAFFGSPYEQNEDTRSSLISILSGGHIQAKFPYYFSLKPLNCYLLLYTEGGCGKLYTETGSHSLEEHSLLFLKCDTPFKVETVISPWNYLVFFLEGTPMDFYYKCLPTDTVPLFMLPDYSYITKNMNQLADRGTSNSVKNKLTDHRLLTDILTGLLLENIEEQSQQKKIPAYLSEMKTIFDVEYQKNYTLDELEEHFSISKYRLCREFHSYFGQPPLQYLNGKRVDAAKDLLLTTDYRIHEIGSLVGIDNTNHFIYLFKKFTGMTPMTFRRRL